MLGGFDDLKGSKMQVLNRTRSFIEHGFKQHLLVFVQVLLNYHDNVECRDLCKKDCGCKCHKRQVR